jgi:hypothetical protein
LAKSCDRDPDWLLRPAAGTELLTALRDLLPRVRRGCLETVHLT